MTRSKVSRRFGIGAFAVACAIGIAACSSSGGSSSTTPSPSTSSTGTAPSSTAPVSDAASFTFAIDQDFAGFNINTLDDNAFVLQEVLNNTWPQVYLTTNTLSEKLDTDYVTSAKVTSTNPQTVVYQINPKAVWSDGTAITAADFQYLWESLSGNPKFKDVGGKAYDPAGTAGYSSIKSVTGSNGGKTVTTVYSQPFGDWQSLFSDLMPAHIAEKVGFNDGFQNFDAAVKVSGGPYEISSYTKGQDLIETPNPKWWGTPVHVKQLVFKIIPDDTQMPAALQNGEVDAANPAQAALTYKEQVAQIPGMTDNIQGGLEYQHIDFNEANPYLAKLAVRQAIDHGFNRAEMVSRIVGPVSSSVKPLENRIYTPNQPQYQDTSNGYGDFDVAKAKSLLAGAGFKMASDGYYQPTFGPEAGKDLTLSISSTKGNPVRSEIEQLFQADMKAIGIKITILNYDADTLFGTVLPKGTFDITEFAWVATPFASSNQTIYCSYTNSNLCGSNYDHYADPAVDKLLTTALATVDPKAAAVLYNQVDALLWKDAVTLPLFQQPQENTYSDKFANILPNASNSGLTWNAFDWGAKA